MFVRGNNQIYKLANPTSEERQSHMNKNMKLSKNKARLCTMSHTNDDCGHAAFVTMAANVTAAQFSHQVVSWQNCQAA